MPQIITDLLRSFRVYLWLKTMGSEAWRPGE
jgi:hypothetical protein